MRQRDDRFATGAQAQRRAPTPPVLRIAGLSKTFGATRALIDASLDIRPGEIHALVGQNGSGKSTLIKTLAGYHAPDPGSEAEIDGAPFDLGHAVPDGLRFVHQDLGLVLELNAMDNLALHGGFARGAMGACAGASRSRRPTACSRASASTSTSTARSPPRRRSSGRSSRSPRRCRAGRAAAACSCSTSRRRSCRTTRSSGCSRWSARSGAPGTSVLYVSHRLDEIFELADRVTVLRGGRVIATHAVADIDAAGSRA